MRGEAGDLGEPEAQRVHELERALDQVLGLVGVQPAQARQRGDALADLGVVLHRARAQRIGSRLDAVVARRQLGEVAHEIDLGDLGQARRPAAQRDAGEQLVHRGLGHARCGEAVGAAAGPRLLVDGSQSGRRSAGRCVVARRVSAKEASHLLDEGVDLGARAPLAHREQQDVVEAGPKRPRSRPAR